MTTRFLNDRRKDLFRVLKQHGCLQPEDVVSKIEGLVHDYRERFLDDGDAVYSNLASTAQATLVVECANALCEGLDELNAVSRRRMERERRRRGEELSFSEYAEAANDICMFAIYAQERGLNQTEESDALVDQATKILIQRLIGVWVQGTGRCLPQLPSGQHALLSWRQQQQIEQHPVWIAMAELDIQLTSYGLEMAIRAALREVPASNLLQLSHHSVGVEQEGLAQESG